MTVSISRSDWPRYLCAVPAYKVEQLASQFTVAFQVEDLMLPQSGLALLQIQESVLNDRYFLGDIPMAQAKIRISDGNGRFSEGSAQIMDDRVSLARAIAILDAALAAQLPDLEAVYDLLREGKAVVEKLQQQRLTLLGKTKVDFSLLSTSEEIDEDE